jgi:Cd2+/Zn2+-exporting ATPase
MTMVSINMAAYLANAANLSFHCFAAHFSALVFLIDKLFPQPHSWIFFALYIAAYFFGGFYTLKEAIESISRGNFEIDFLMLVAAVGAAALGAWAEGALLLFLFSLGHSLENMAMQKARKSIEALAGLAPKRRM